MSSSPASSDRDAHVAASALDRDLRKVKRALEFYADPETWGEDDWGVRAVNTMEYGNSGRRASRALPAMRRLIDAHVMSLETKP